MIISNSSFDSISGCKANHSQSFRLIAVIGHETSGIALCLVSDWFMPHCHWLFSFNSKPPHILFCTHIEEFSFEPNCKLKNFYRRRPWLLKTLLWTFILALNLLKKNSSHLRAAQLLYITGSYNEITCSFLFYSSPQKSYFQ